MICPGRLNFRVTFLHPQVFVALLRTCQPEARALVRQALDILTPALPRRLQSADHSGHKVRAGDVSRVCMWAQVCFRP